MGFDKALNEWQRLLTDTGHLVISDLVWVKDHPFPDVRKFWTNAYPGMKSVNDRLQQVNKNGYSLVSHFLLGKDAWDNYTKPLATRIEELSPLLTDSRALADLLEELAIHRQNKRLDQYNYLFMILKKESTPC
jgi:SAM-dependent methyltransferase